MNPFAYDAISGHGIDALDIMRAVIVRSSVVLAIVVMIRYFLRDRLSNAAKHALLLIVPFETAAVLAFAIWPMRIELQLPFDSPVSPLLSTFAGGSLDPGTKDEKTATLQPIDRSFDERSAIASSEAPAGFSQGLSSSALDATNDRTGQVPIMSDSGRTDATSLSTIAGICWFAGSSLLAFVFLVRHLRMSFRLRSTWGPASDEMRHMVDSLAKLMRLRHRPGIMETRAVATPAVVGIFRPVLVIPAGFEDEFEADECRWALAHELAHVQRFDLWTLAFERAVGIVCFFCPALWITQRMTRHDRELACDDAAQAASGLSAGDCAGVFLKLIRWSSRRESGSGGMTPVLSLTHRYPAIRNRILNMTDANEARRTPRLATTTAWVITAFAIVLALPVVPKLVAQSPRDARNEITLARNEDAATETRQANESQTKTRSIGGVIVDQNGMPIANAEVNFLIWVRRSAEISPKRLTPARTGSDGRFRIEGIPDNGPIAMVQFTHPDYVTRHITYRVQEVEYEPLRKGEARIEMQKGIAVRGRVLDPDGKPLAGAVLNQMYKSYFSDVSKRTTDENGGFSFEHLDETTFDSLIVTKPGFGTIIGKWNHAQRPPGELVLKMERARSLSGKVTDESEKPLPDVRLSVALLYSPNEFKAEARTDAEGQFRIDDLPVGRDMRIQILKQGYAESFFSLKADQKDGLAIKLLKGVTGNGTVVDAVTGKPVERFKVTIVPFEDRSLVQSSNTYPFAAGAFEMRASTVSPKRFRLTIGADGYRDFESEEYAIDQCPVKLEVKLEPIPDDEKPRYRGRVVAQDGTPIENARIGLSTPRDFPLIHDGAIYATWRGREIPVTDASGAFDFRSLEPVGELLILHETGTIRKPIEPGTDLNAIELKLEPYGHIAGKLLRNGKPDRDSRIAVFYKALASRRTGSGHMIEPKPDGTFLLERVIPGVVDIDFRLAGIPENGRFTAMQPYLVEPGKTTTIECDLKLSDSPRRDLKGKIRFVDREIPMNLSGSKFILYPPKDNPLRLKPGDAIVNSPARMKYRETPEGKAMQQALDEFLLLEKSMTPDGEFEIKGMPVGHYELRIWAGNSNTNLGDAVREIRIEPAKPGEPESPIDLGVLDIARMKNISGKPVSKESSKSNAQPTAKPGS